MKGFVDFLPALVFGAIGLVLLLGGRENGGITGFFARDSLGQLTLVREVEPPDPLMATLQKAYPLPSALKVSIIDARGTQEKLNILKEKQADAALLRTGLGLDMGGVLAVATAGRHYAHIVVPAASELFSFRDLAGQRIGVGPPAGDADLFARRVLSYLNFDEPPLLVNGQQTNVQRAFAEGVLDAALLLEPLLSPQIDTLLSSGYFRLLPVPEAEAIARVLFGVEAEVMPGKLYGPERALPPLEAGPFPVLAVESVLAAHPDTPPGDIAALLQDLLALPADSGTGLVSFALPHDAGLHGWRVHPGVTRVLDLSAPLTREALNSFGRRCAGWGLLLLAAWQLFHAWQRLQARARRRELHEWFELVQDIGARMEVAEGPRELGRLVDDLASKQRLAERAFVTGKMDQGELLLFTTAHQVRLLDALGKHGHSIESIPVAQDGAHPTSPPPSFFTSYAGALEPETEEELERTPTIMRPDFGEALINTVRVRRRDAEPAPSSVTAEPALEPAGSVRAGAAPEEEHQPGNKPRIPEPAPEASAQDRDHEAPRQETSVTEAEKAPDPAPRRKKRGRGGRQQRQERQEHQERQQREHAAAEDQPPAQPAQHEGKKLTKEQLDLFGRRV